MRRKISVVLMCAVYCCIFAAPFQCMASETSPSLASISFKNAVINEKFTPDVQEYTITLDDNQESPTLESYKINGTADIFVNYTYNDANHQTGITATLQYDKGSMIYNFVYSNPAVNSDNSDNILSSIFCTYGEISPQLNNEDTSYKLYIPSDLTHLTITPVTRDVNAYCPPVELILDDNQTPKITLYSTAANGSKREYSLNIKRVAKTTSQVKAEMERPDFTSFVEGTRLYQRPEFIITVCAVAGGAAVVWTLFAITRRVAVNPYDKDEKPFYTPVD